MTLHKPSKYCGAHQKAVIVRRCHHVHAHCGMLIFVNWRFMNKI